jgi:hypothetical protein
MDGLLDLQKEIMYAIESLQEINYCALKKFLMLL